MYQRIKININIFYLHNYISIMIRILYTILVIRELILIIAQWKVVNLKIKNWFNQNEYYML